LLQGMAGNIIHAIATTNAIISGLLVIEALKLISGAFESSQVGAAGCNIISKFCVHSWQCVPQGV
jgi:hypothetical protein